LYQGVGINLEYHSDIIIIKQDLMLISLLSALFSQFSLKLLVSGQKCLVQGTHLL
jgi:hypothetical protein